MTTSLEALTGLYVQTRDKIKLLEAGHKAELLPFREALDDVERHMMTALNDIGAESMKTTQGTVYKASWTKARVEDWQKVLDYAIENQRWDLFQRSVAKTVVEELGSVPGIDLERGVRINVRRS